MSQARNIAIAVAGWLCAASLAAALLPALASAGPRCAGLKPTLVGTPGDDVLISKRRDVIWAGSGDDVIRGGGGNDVICGGAGDDTIYAGRGIDRAYGGGGDDRLSGQQGTDYLWGGVGEDTILGQRGSDRILGGGGRDTLLGGAGNDRIDGGGGARDVLIGGSGDDRLDGGRGDADHVYGGLGADLVDGGPGSFDLVRGDEGHDILDGGGGNHDIASFATANPPGAAAFGLDGVLVDLRRGIAYGDGFGLGPSHGIDRLRKVEDVIGSPFNDRIVGNGRTSRIEGGFGRDAIGGGARISSRANLAAASEDPTPHATYVGFAASLDDYSVLHVVGSTGPDGIGVSAQGSSIVVVDPAGLTTDTPGSLPPGTGCSLNPEGTVATCASVGGIDTLAVSSGEGNDTVKIGDSVPRTLAAYLNGGEGSDVINGGPEDDFIHGGASGQDTLNGGDGDDSLQSDSGGGRVHGGDGDDLIVISRPCNGENVQGGPGVDRVAFNPAPSGVLATIGGEIWAGGGCQPGSIGSDVENLEGSKHADTLIGDGGPNSLTGRKGDDTLVGRGGSDELEGGPGRDTCAGGGGRDWASSCEAPRQIP